MHKASQELADVINRMYELHEKISSLSPTSEEERAFYEKNLSVVSGHYSLAARDWRNIALNHSFFQQVVGWMNRTFPDAEKEIIYGTRIHMRGHDDIMLWPVGNDMKISIVLNGDIRYVGTVENLSDITRIWQLINKNS